MKLSRSDYRRMRLYCLLAFKITYLTNTNSSSLCQTDILGICKITGTFTKASQTFVLIEEFA